jgi:hypothetical protein
VNDESLVPERVFFVLLWCGIVSVVLLFMIWNRLAQTPMIGIAEIPREILDDITTEVKAARARNPLPSGVVPIRRPGKRRRDK